MGAELRLILSGSGKKNIENGCTSASRCALTDAIDVILQYRKLKLQQLRDHRILIIEQSFNSHQNHDLSES